MVKGGDLISCMSPEKKKEYCKNMSLITSGVKNHSFGKTKSHTHREKISRTLKGKKLSQQHKENISKGQLGKKRPRRLK